MKNKDLESEIQKELKILHRSIPKDKSLSITHPHVASQWHPAKNGDLTPDDITPGSDKKAWWKCGKGHEWEATIANRTNGTGCPYCTGRKVCIDNCLATIRPDLAKQWHPTKNGKLTPDDITHGSHKKVWWLCEKCHEWEEAINNRAKGRGCPYCSHHRVSKDNSLALLYPKIALQWHPTKNEKLTSYDVLPKSNKKVWWQCEKSHEWEAVIGSRINGSGCPYCVNQKVSEDNSLASLRPDLSEQWHPTKNEELTPYNVLPYSNKKVWWQCKKGHEWEVAVANRTSGSGCPYCSNQKVCKDNSLASLHPKIAEQWHLTKNGGLTPDDITSGSEKKVWWQCKKGHEWETTVVNRTKGTGCPYCNKENHTSFPEQTIYYYIKKIFNDAVNGFRLPANQRMEADIYIDSLNIAIEYDGETFHNDKKIQNDEHKNRILKEENIKLIRVREENCPDIEMYGHHLIKSSSSSKRDYLSLNDVVEQIFDFILKTKNLSPLIISNINSIKIDVLKDKSKIESLYLKREKENSLANLFPALISEWHHIKNSPVTPDMVYAKSNKRFWWICKNGHEWESTVCGRTRGNGCPYCSNQKVCQDNSLASLYPKIAEQWHLTKNGNLTPDNVVPGTNKKVWWKCEKGHEWEASVSSRKSGSGCPYCSSQKVCKDNSLASLYPKIAVRWHPTKNGDLTPNDITSGTNKKVWWKCEKGHEWEASVNHRTRGNGCPYCSNKKACKDNSLASLYPKIAEQWHPTKNGNLIPDDFTSGSGKNVWWKCSKCNKEYQMRIQGKTRSGHLYCPECAKKEISIIKN